MRGSQNSKRLGANRLPAKANAKVYCVDTDKTFPNVSQAAKSIGVGRYYLARCIETGKLCKERRYIFEHEG